jgi:hypothetical protein
MRKFFGQKSKQKTGSSLVMPLLPLNKSDEKPNSTQTADNTLKQDDNVEKSKKLFVVVSGKYFLFFSIGK